MLYRLVDPRTVRVTPSAKSVAEQIHTNAGLIAEHRRQTNKSTMDGGENYFTSQRRHLTEFFRLQDEQKILMRKFNSHERGALLVSLARRILGLEHPQTKQDAS